MRVFGSGARAAAGTHVRLNVYDLNDRVNDLVSAVGLGLYHSGVEIDGREYTYAGGAGIHDTRPRAVPPNVTFRCSLDLGLFDGGARRLAQCVDELRGEFPPQGYDLVTKNCNHFSDCLVHKLLQAHIPSWINRAAMLGSCVVCLLPRPPQEAATDGPAAVTFTPFGGGGNSLGGGEMHRPDAPPPPLTPTHDRKDAACAKIRAAALRRLEASPD
ncbi:PPPDE putative peptidase domain-containing protein [Pelagophyceae sp. CCMP2097]|nr:PPPDE putative peptidase domain-containing protein [Pelagophyceae sp. CCMP2097]